MAIARVQRIIVVDPNADEAGFVDAVQDVLERATDWIIIADTEDTYSFAWDDDLEINEEGCTFEQARRELAQIGEKQ